MGDSADALNALITWAEAQVASLRESHTTPTGVLADADVQREVDYVEALIALLRRTEAVRRIKDYERDLFDSAHRDRSQDVDWLRAGFLQRGLEIEQLEQRIDTAVAWLEQSATPFDNACALLRDKDKGASEG